jgi:hypothetical protein
MNANLQQLHRIRRCYRFIARRHPQVGVELVARMWIVRYAGHWRGRHRDV